MRWARRALDRWVAQQSIQRFLQLLGKLTDAERRSTEEMFEAERRALKKSEDSDNRS